MLKAIYLFFIIFYIFYFYFIIFPHTFDKYNFFLLFEIHTYSNAGWASVSWPRSTHHSSYGFIIELTEDKRRKIKEKKSISLGLTKILLLNLPSKTAYFATVLLQYFLKLVEFYFHLTMIQQWNKRTLVKGQKEHGRTQFNNMKLNCRILLQIWHCAVKLHLKLWVSNFRHTVQISSLSLIGLLHLQNVMNHVNNFKLHLLKNLIYFWHTSYVYIYCSYIIIIIFHSSIVYVSFLLQTFVWGTRWNNHIWSPLLIWKKWNLVVQEYSSPNCSTQQRRIIQSCFTGIIYL